MPDAVLMCDTESSLAEAAILSEPWLSTATSPDVLARSDIVTAAAEQSMSAPRRVVIRTPGLVVEIQARGPLPESFLKSIQGVADLLSLPSGWSSYSAKPIAPQNATRAIRLLAEFLRPEIPPPLIVPTVRGGIQLEWHTKGINIEIYIDTPESIRFFAEHVESEASFEGSLAGHEQELRLWMERISGK